MQISRASPADLFKGQSGLRIQVFLCAFVLYSVFIFLNIYLLSALEVFPVVSVMQQCVVLFGKINQAVFYGYHQNSNLERSIKLRVVTKWGNLRVCSVHYIFIWFFCWKEASSIGRHGNGYKWVNLHFKIIGICTNARDFKRGLKNHISDKKQNKER